MVCGFYSTNIVNHAPMTEVNNEDNSNAVALPKEVIVLPCTQVLRSNDAA